MHLRQIADDTAGDVHYHPRSAGRKMTRILRMSKDVDSQTVCHVLIRDVIVSISMSSRCHERHQSENRGQRLADGLAAGRRGLGVGSVNAVSK